MKELHDAASLMRAANSQISEGAMTVRDRTADILVEIAKGMPRMEIADNRRLTYYLDELEALTFLGIACARFKVFFPEDWLLEILGKKFNKTYGEVVAEIERQVNG